MPRGRQQAILVTSPRSGGVRRDEHKQRRLTPSPLTQLDTIPNESLQNYCAYAKVVVGDTTAKFSEWGRRTQLPLYQSQLSIRTRTEIRSEEHTSELQSLRHLVCRL